MLGNDRSEGVFKRVAIFPALNEIACSSSLQCVWYSKSEAGTPARRCSLEGTLARVPTPIVRIGSGNCFLPPPSYGNSLFCHRLASDAPLSRKARSNQGHTLGRKAEQ